jgi:hypothetical protein
MPRGRTNLTLRVVPGLRAARPASVRHSECRPACQPSARPASPARSPPALPAANRSWPSVRRRYGSHGDTPLDKPAPGRSAPAAASCALTFQSRTPLQMLWRSVAMLQRWPLLSSLGYGLVCALVGRSRGRNPIPACPGRSRRWLAADTSHNTSAGSTGLMALGSSRSPRALPCTRHRLDRRRWVASECR